jgi:hypothetical protein
MGSVAWENTSTDLTEHKASAHSIDPELQEFHREKPIWVIRNTEFVLHV